MMKRLPILLDLAGVASIAAAAFLFNTITGLLTAGAGLFVAAYLLEREP